jgi:hypothetical protein
MPRVQQLAPVVFESIDIAPLVERHLDTLQIDVPIESESSTLREQARRLEDQAIRSLTAVSNDALANFGLASAGGTNAGGTTGPTTRTVDDSC